MSECDCHDDKMNYRCVCTECCRVAQTERREKLHWSPNPEGVCYFLGNRKPRMTIYGMGVCDFVGNHKWGFVIYSVCDLLLQRHRLELPTVPGTNWNSELALLVLCTMLSISWSVLKLVCRGFGFVNKYQITPC